MMIELPELVIEWGGPAISELDIRGILAMDQSPHTREEYDHAKAFISGDQWDAEIKSDRISKDRATVVINRVALYVDAVICKSLDEDLTRENMNRLYVIVYRKCGDAQRMYNYCFSARLEMLRRPERSAGCFGRIGEDGKFTRKEFPA